MTSTSWKWSNVEEDALGYEDALGDYDVLDGDVDVYQDMNEVSLNVF